MYEISEILGESSMLPFAVLILAYGFLFLTFTVTIATYFIQSIGLLEMYEKLGLKNKWMVFFPFLNTYAFGKIAQQYVKLNGEKSIKFSDVLFLGKFANLFLNIVIFFGSVVVSTITNSFMSSFIYMFELPVDYYTMSSILSIIYILFVILCLILELILLVMNYIALWQVYAIFSKKAILLLVFSIIFPILQPIFIFMIRNNEPKHIEYSIIG